MHLICWGCLTLDKAVAPEYKVCWSLTEEYSCKPANTYLIIKTWCYTFTVWTNSCHIMSSAPLKGAYEFFIFLIRVKPDIVIITVCKWMLLNIPALTLAQIFSGLFSSLSISWSGRIRIFLFFAAISHRYRGTFSLRGRTDLVYRMCFVSKGFLLILYLPYNEECLIMKNIVRDVVLWSEVTKAV